MHNTGDMGMTGEDPSPRFMTPLPKEDRDISPRFAAQLAKQEAAVARFEKNAVIGKSVDEAKAWCQANDFPIVLVEGSTHVLSFVPGRIRLHAEAGVVIGASVG